MRGGVLSKAFSTKSCVDLLVYCTERRRSRILGQRTLEVHAFPTPKGCTPDIEARFSIDGPSLKVCIDTGTIPLSISRKTHQRLLPTQPLIPLRKTRQVSSPGSGY